jgi:hypothetical protein
MLRKTTQPPVAVVVSPIAFIVPPVFMPPVALMPLAVVMEDNILTCQQIGSTLVRPDIGLEGKLWTQVIHLLVITGAKYPQECFPDFITVDESVLSILNTKKGTSDHMELLR